MKAVIFAVGTFLLMAISWKALLVPRSHGFYRFFAWEGILALWLLNIRYWFANPFAWNQLIAWSLLVLCLVPLALGVKSLRTRGNPARYRQNEPGLLAFEKTTTLVTDGIYQYIRHPLYCSLLLLTWGIFFKFPAWIGFVLALTTTLLLFATARADEAECLRFFGNAYRTYIRRTKMFIPYLF